MDFSAIKLQSVGFDPIFIQPSSSRAVIKSSSDPTHESLSRELPVSANERAELLATDQSEAGKLAGCQK